MKFLNLFEKIKVVYNIVINSDLFVILFILMIFMLLLRLFNKINNKKLNLMLYLIELVIFLVILFNNKEYLIDVFNSLINNIFLNFYFPSSYIYITILLCTYIMFICTILNKNLSKIYKVLTNIYFNTFNFIFVLLVNEIAVYDIDIFEVSSLYTNNNVLVLLELSTLIFFVYLILNLLIYITNSLIVIVKFKKTINVNSEIAITNPNLVISTDYNNAKLIEDNEVVITNNNVSFNELVNNLPKIDLVPEYDKITFTNKDKFKFIDPEIFNEFDYQENLSEKTNFIDFNIINKSSDKISLNDYKLFSNMLKTIIKLNGNKNLNISDILNNNLTNIYTKEEYNKFEKILNSCLN